MAAVPEGFIPDAPEGFSADAPAKSGPKLGELGGREGSLGGDIMTLGKQAVAKTAGLPARAARLMTGIDKPQSAEDIAIMAVAGTPVVGGAGAAGAALASRIGALPGALPAAARVAASGALGGLQDGVPGAALGAIGGTLAEGAGTALRRIAQRVLGDPVEIGTSLRNIYRGLLSPGAKGSGKWFDVPALSSAKLTFEEALTGLSRATGKTWNEARDQIAATLTKLDPQKAAGQAFLETTATRARLAAGARNAAAAPTTQAALDATLAEPDASMVAQGAIGALPGAVIHRIPGVSILQHVGGH